MRNLKRVLSLALAALMLMGMMVVGAGAASKDFTDADEITNVEAVDVMVALGVLEGGDKGDFQPNSILTREQAAKIICYMLLGEEAAEKLTTNYSIFSDVPANRWSAPYISYCVNLGILAGDGAGHFYPEGKLTGVAFAKMLLVCLGYSAERENYVGNNWEINVSAAAIAAGVAPKGLVLSNELSRQDAAQMAFNTLKATMVEYLNDNTIIIGGETIISTTGKASAVKQAPYTDTMGTEYLQFAEKYFSDLDKINSSDAFGRPARVWEYDGEKVGTYVKTELLQNSYTTSVTGKDLYNDLGSSVLAKYTNHVYIDGVENDSELSKITRTYTKNFGNTDNGVLTEVYVDSANKEATITVINTYLAKANADYTTKRDYAPLTVWGIDTNVSGDYVKNAGTTGTSKTLNVYSEDFAVAEDIKADDFFLVTVAQGAIQTIAEPEVVNETTIRSFKKGNWVVSDGTTYDYSGTVTYKTDVLDAYDDNNMKETTYNLYLDQYGYMIGIEIVDSEDNYVFITGYEGFSSVLTSAKTEARAIFTDGTVSTITVKDAADTVQKDGTNKWAAAGEANENGWYTYAVDKNGEYELTPVAGSITTGVKVAQGQDKTDGKEINKSHVSLKVTTSSYAYGNDDTVYLGTKLNAAGTQITGLKTTVTGVKNTNMKLSANSSEPDGAYVLYNDKGYIIAAVVVGQNMAVSANYAYIIGDVQQEDYDSDKDEYTWHRKAVINGEEVILREKGSSLKVIGETSTKGNMKKDTWYEVEYDAEGYVIGKSAITWDNIADLDGDTYATASVQGFNTVKTGYDKEDVVLVRQKMDTADFKLVLDGMTVYVRNNKAIDSGIAIVPGAKVVLIDNWNDSGREVEYFDAGEGNNNVKAALDEMVSTTFNGSVYFVMKDGVAESIIINDTDVHNTGNNPISPNNKVVVKSVDEVNHVITLKKGVADNSDPAKVQPVVNEALYNAGWRWTKWNTTDPGPWTVEAVESSSSNPAPITFSVVVEA